MNCACEQDADGRVVGFCGAHSMAMRQHRDCWRENMQKVVDGCDTAALLLLADGKAHEARGVMTARQNIVAEMRRSM